MRLSTVAVVLLLLTLPAMGQTDTEDLLQAPRVRTYVRLRIPPPPGTDVSYRVDHPDDAFFALPEGAVFVAASAVSVRIADFNPMLLVITAGHTLEDDPNYRAVGGFLEQLLALGRQVGVLTGDVLLGGAAQADETRDECKKLAAAERRIKGATAPNELTAEKLVELANGATGFAGLHEAVVKLAKAREELKDNLDSLAAAEAAVLVITNASTFQIRRCSTLDPVRLTNVRELGRRASETKRKLLETLDGILASLHPFDTQPGNWRDGRDKLSDFEILAHEDSYKRDRVTITVARRSYSLTSAGLVVATQTPVSRTIVFRHHSVLVPEVAAAAIYSELRYPRYGTQQRDGQTVVAPVSDSAGRVDAALMLNLVCRCWGPSFIYPEAQLGVSTAKDFPGLLVGLGVRFVKIRSLSLSAGRMFTYFKDLDKLKVGDPISGTAALEEDLTLRRAPTAWYVALQYAFK